MDDNKKKIYNLKIKIRNKLIDANKCLIKENFNIEYSNDITYIKSSIKNEIINTCKNSMENQSFLFETWIGEIAKYSTVRFKLPFEMYLDKNEEIFTLEEIPENSLICFVSGVLKYRPLFFWDRSKHFSYNIGYTVGKYIIDTSSKSNISSFFGESKFNHNITLVPIYIDCIREIAVFSTRVIKSGEKLMVSL